MSQSSSSLLRSFSFILFPIVIPLSFLLHDFLHGWSQTSHSLNKMTIMCEQNGNSSLTLAPSYDQCLSSVFTINQGERPPSSWFCRGETDMKKIALHFNIVINHRVELCLRSPLSISWVQSHSVREDPLMKEMATHSGILLWELPWAEEPPIGYSPWGHKLDARRLILASFS